MAGARHYYKLDEAAKKRIIARYKAGLSCASIAKCFGVHGSTISGIIKEYDKLAGKGRAS